MSKLSPLARHLLSMLAVVVALGIPGLFALGGATENLAATEKRVDTVEEKLDNFSLNQAAMQARLEAMDKNSKEFREETRRSLERILDKLDNRQ